jgi:hypothetical protein
VRWLDASPVRARAAGSTPFATEREHVPPDTVVERECGGEQRGQEQQLGRLRRRAAPQAEQQAGALLACGGNDVALAGVGGHRPGGQRPCPPRRVQVQVGRGLAGRARPERPVQAHLQTGIGQQGDQRGSHTDDAAKTVGYERIWGWHMFGSSNLGWCLGYLSSDVFADL